MTDHCPALGLLLCPLLAPKGWSKEQVGQSQEPQCLETRESPKRASVDRGKHMPTALHAAADVSCHRLSTP